ncbi:hypothetical protein GGP41_001146 [Bipolaris sorokiniana]|uniref:Yeast cell wall synthesis Kre9/Knh1-like N-terminal domain-containing protein n=2 Tax=Cochliobolus sativus TaxID=45130 RepID=A0A8H5ZAH5_COCSA|nr:uncharacterized protein COCSADRAFT_32403 [Bipolaris sorokiniana ND90Pr]EMD69723.1 hypothetical protein COCSADRAFT_32403 [Bipolaris sorokiniana ND90Pr]KAF5845049.1 hypothetical protein GGP41_001146 [Bipolaris sorokiniana]
MYSKATIVSIFAGFAAAQIHPAVGDPKGNPITRPLNEVVPKCEPFTITWEPTTPNSVSVLLLKGPATNVVKFGPSLAEGIKNSGSLTWTPAADLPITEANQGYGLQIIDDVTGQYQYSTQFGISAGKCGTVSSSAAPSVAPSSAVPSVAPSSAPAAGYPASSAPAGYPAHTPVAPSSVASVAPYPTTMASAPAAVGTGGLYPNGTVPKPTGGNSTTPPLPEQTTNAAAGLSAGLGLVGAAAAVVAFML